MDKETKEELDAKFNYYAKNGGLDLACKKVYGLTEEQYIKAHQDASEPTEIKYYPDKGHPKYPTMYWILDTLEYCKADGLNVVYMWHGKKDYFKHPIHSKKTSCISDIYMQVLGINQKDYGLGSLLEDEDIDGKKRRLIATGYALMDPKASRKAMKLYATYSIQSDEKAGISLELALEMMKYINKGDYKTANSFYEEVLKKKKDAEMLIYAMTVVRQFARHGEDFYNWKFGYEKYANKEEEPKHSRGR